MRSHAGAHRSLADSSSVGKRLREEFGKSRASEASEMLVPIGRWRVALSVCVIGYYVASYPAFIVPIWAFGL